MNGKDGFNLINKTDQSLAKKYSGMRGLKPGRGTGTMPLGNLFSQFFSSPEFRYPI